MKFAGGLALVLAMGTGVASAQLCEIVVGQVDFDAGGNPSPFTCTDGTECLLYQRVYGDLDPTLVNQSTTNDGYPAYAAKRGRWVGDAYGTANYPGINDANSACANWYGVWTGAVGAGGADYVSFYAGQATIVNFGENGQPNQPDCVATAVDPVACMGEIRAGENNNTGGATYPNAPFGNVASPALGLEPVPIPEVSITADSAVLALSWPAAAMANLTNTASTTGAACPALAQANDLEGAAAAVANPIWAVRLFAYPGGYRTLLQLENAGATAAGGIDVLGDAGRAGLACPGTCGPEVVQIACNATSGGSCQGDELDFSPTAQSIQVSRAAVEGALGRALTSGEPVVFVTKVVFRGATAGSAVSGGSPDPSNVSLFGGNSQTAGFDGLISSVALEAAAGRGPFVDLAITTTGEVLSMRLERSENGIDFEPIGTIDIVPGQNEYTFSDRIRGVGQAQLTYKVVYETPSGESQTFATFSGASQGRGR